MKWNNDNFIWNFQGWGWFIGSRVATVWDFHIMVTVSRNSTVSQYDGIRYFKIIIMIFIISSSTSSIISYNDP